MGNWEPAKAANVAIGKTHIVTGTASIKRLDDEDPIDLGEPPRPKAAGPNRRARRARDARRRRNGVA